MKFLTALLILFVAACCIFTGCAPKNEFSIEQAQKDPCKYLTNAFEKTSEAMSAGSNQQTMVLLKALSEKGSLSLNIQIPDTATVDLSADYDHQDISASLTVDISGQQIDLQWWTNGTAMCLKAPQLLGDSVYGLSFENLKEDMAHCEIWAMLGISYEDVRAELEPTLDQLEKMVAGGDQSTQKLQKVIEKIKLLSTEIQYSAAESGENAVEISCSMSKEQLDKLVDILLDATADELLTGIAGRNGDTTIEQIRDTLKQATGDVTIQAIISNETGLITAAHIEYHYQDEGESKLLKIAADLSDLKNISVTATSEEDVIILDIKNKDVEGTFARTIALKINNEEAFLLDLTYHDSDFALTIVSDGETAVLKGNCTMTATTLQLSELRLSADGVEETLPITLTLCTEANVEKMPQYTNLLKMTQQEWVALMEIIGALFPQEPAY